MTTSEPVPTPITLKPGDELTADLLYALREQARAENNPNVYMLVRFIEERRADHEQRLLFSRLLSKHALRFAKMMRSFEFLTEPDTMAHKMYVGVIDNFINDWKDWLTMEPKSFEPTNITKEVSEDGTNMHVRYTHWTATVVGAMLAESLLRPHDDPEKDRHIYFNHVTLTMTHSGQKFAVVLQRCDGKTPGESLAEAKADLEKARTAGLLLRECLAGLLKDDGKSGGPIVAARDALANTTWLDEVT